MPVGRGVSLSLALVGLLLLTAMPLAAATGLHPSGTPRLVNGGANALANHGPTPRRAYAEPVSGSPSSWQEFNITNPPARIWEGLAYDPVDGYTVMFGGDGEKPYNYTVPIGDTWVYAEQRWTELCSGTNATPTCAVSPPAGPASMAYDPMAGYVLLVDSAGDSWSFLHGTWTQLAVTGRPSICNLTSEVCGQSGSPLTYDPSTGSVVFFAANTSTWSYTNGAWSEVSASAPTVASNRCGIDVTLYYDSSYGSLVLLCPNAIGYVWIGGNWTTLSGSPSPPGYISAGDWDPSLGALVVDDYARSADSPGSTWSFVNGSWINRSSVVGVEPPQAYWRTMVYDANDGYSLLFGGQNLSVIAPETDENSTWALTDPFNVSVTVVPSTLEVGQNLTLSVSVSGGVPPTSLNWTGLPVGCAAPTPGTPTACSPRVAASYAVIVTGTNPGTHSSAEASALVQVLPALEVAAVVDPLNGTAPLVVHCTAVAVGGLAPYQYSWGGFPAPMPGGSPNVTGHYGAGSYILYLFVVDSLNYTVERTFNISVLPAPAIAPLTVQVFASQTHCAAPCGITFYSAVANGTSPYNSYYWNFDNGQTAGTASAAVAYTYPGTFNVTLKVTNSAGQNGTATLEVVVTPALALMASYAILSHGPPVSVQFTLAASGGIAPYVFVWNFGDGTGSSAQDPVHNFTMGGNYTASAEVVDASGRHVTFPLSLALVAGKNATPPPPPTANPGITTEGWELALSVGVLGALIGAAVTIVLRRRGRQPKAGLP